MKQPICLANTMRRIALLLLTIVPLSFTTATQAADRQQVDFSQAELDQMLAPVALYPDTLLSQVLIAATYPLEVIQADRWLRNNKDLSAEDALKFAKNKDWDPSVKSLVAFPDVLKRMSEDVDWTQRLGDAFLSDEEAVMDAVQRLRKRAYATGNLNKAKHINVERDDDYIIIEPAEERVIYVPVYDTRVVYGNWWWPDYPPIYWHYPSSYTYVSGFYWGTSIYLGPSYFYSSCRWRDRRVVVIDYRHHDDYTRFYSRRDILRHADARDWRHDPKHRHGVAYYNNNLRETYGSRHVSRENDREYRRQFDQGGGSPNPRISDGWRRDGQNRNNPQVIENGNNRHPNQQNGGDNSRDNHQVDRAEQVRQRLARENNLREHRPWGNNGSVNPRGEPMQQQPRQFEGDDNNSPSRAGEPDRNPGPQQWQRNDNGDNRVQLPQQRRIVTDQAELRPNFSRPSQRTEEPQTPNFGEQRQSVERQMPQPRMDVPAPRNDAEGRTQVQQRAERIQNHPRFSRDKNDDNTK